MHRLDCNAVQTPLKQDRYSNEDDLGIAGLNLDETVNPFEDEQVRRHNVCSIPEAEPGVILF